MKNAIISDDGTGTFAPSEPVTREQLADILWRYAKYKGLESGTGTNPGVQQYADVFAITAELRDGLNWACSNGIIQGKGDGSLLMPQDGATRAEVAVVLKRLTEL